MIAHWSPRNWLSRGFIDIWVLPNRGVPLFTIGCPIKNARLWGSGWLGKTSFLSWNYSWNVQVTNAGRKYSILWVEAVCDDEEAGKRWLDIHPNHANVFFLMFFCRYWYSHIICVFQQKQMIQDACSFFCAWSMTLVNKRCKKSRLQATWKPMQLIHVEWIDNGFDRLPAHWLCCVSRDDKHVALENGLRVFMWAVFRHKISEKDTIGTNITISNCCCQRSGTCANISSKICGSGGDVQHVDKGWEYTMPLSFKMCYSQSQWLYNSCYIILS